MRITRRKRPVPTGTELSPLAAERRHNVAQGVSPGKVSFSTHPAPAGAGTPELCRPSRALKCRRAGFPELTPWATVLRRFAAILQKAVTKKRALALSATV